MIRPGEIYLADFEEMEPHPVVVISRQELNRGNWVVRGKDSRSAQKRKGPTRLP